MLSSTAFPSEKPSTNASPRVSRLNLVVEYERYGLLDPYVFISEASDSLDHEMACGAVIKYHSEGISSPLPPPPPSEKPLARSPRASLKARAVDPAGIGAVAFMFPSSDKSLYDSEELMPPLEKASSVANSEVGTSKGERIPLELKELLVTPDQYFSLVGNVGVKGICVPALTELNEF